MLGLVLFIKPYLGVHKLLKVFVDEFALLRVLLDR